MATSLFYQNMSTVSLHFDYHDYFFIVPSFIVTIHFFIQYYNRHNTQLWKPNQNNTVGAFLDPVADKLMVSTSLILLAGRYGKIAAIPAIIILAREIAVSALREWMAQRGERDAVKVGYQGKVKTALTMTALTVLLYVPTGAATSNILYKIGIPMLYMSAVITITSGSVYFIAAAPALLNKK